jgi:hypothetical protein
VYHLLAYCVHVCITCLLTTWAWVHSTHSKQVIKVASDKGCTSGFNVPCNSLSFSLLILPQSPSSGLRELHFPPAPNFPPPSPPLVLLLYSQQVIKVALLDSKCLLILYPFHYYPFPVGDAHGHGPYPITNSERTLLSAWLKQGRDWLML